MQYLVMFSGIHGDSVRHDTRQLIATVVCLLSMCAGGVLLYCAYPPFVRASILYPEYTWLHISVIYVGLVLFFTPWLLAFSVDDELYIPGILLGLLLLVVLILSVQQWQFDIFTLHTAGILTSFALTYLLSDVVYPQLFQ